MPLITYTDLDMSVLQQAHIVSLVCLLPWPEWCRRSVPYITPRDLVRRSPIHQPTMRGEKASWMPVSPELTANRVQFMDSAPDDEEGAEEPTGSDIPF